MRTLDPCKTNGFILHLGLGVSTARVYVHGKGFTSFCFFNLHRAHMAQDHANLGVLTFRVYVQGKGFTSCFFFIMYKFLHYAYVTGSCKPTICVNNMDRAVDLRVRLVIPSNYPQGTVVLSSAPVFLSYCQGFTSGVIMHRAVTMHVAQDHANLCDHVC